MSASLREQDGPRRRVAGWVLTVLQDGAPAGICCDLCPGEEEARECLDYLASVGVDSRAELLTVELLPSGDAARVIHDPDRGAPLQSCEPAGSLFRSGGGKWRAISGGQPNSRIKFWAVASVKDGNLAFVQSWPEVTERDAVEKVASLRVSAFEHRAYEIIVDLPSLSAASAVAEPGREGEWLAIRPVGVSPRQI